jgi:hypothetical protein
VDDSSDKIRFRDIVIIGGGCYGSFYVGQLLRAAERGKAEYRRLLVVDRDPSCRFAREIGSGDGRELIHQDWDDFFDEFLPGAAAGVGGGPADTIVPSPLMPHLMYRWLVRQAEARWPGRVVETRPVPTSPGTPYDVSAPDGTRYVSYADWICPTHCIEPALCPVIRAPRSWDMVDAMQGLTRRLARSAPTSGPVLLVCEHRVFGVGMFDASAVAAGNAIVATAGAPGTSVDVVVGTISHCHGAVNLLHLGDARGGS